ncbi:MAG: pyruvate dehydrogenase (acetyl-transferring) E1 component subunit alpha [Phycisphaerales bacterium]|nr:MAG: pyruvate dehydrogenase (acetyl-transferring) E1 component subunit alpha [Phycisphaerales bacterium]
MPRKRITIRPTVEYLSILNETGDLDEALDPGLDADRCLYLYRLMVLTRRLDERCINLQRQGRIGTYGPSRGEEAAHCASAIVLEPQDWLVPAFRQPGALIHRGWPEEHAMLFWGGFEEGCRTPDGVNDLPLNVPIASQVPHAMGIAWGMKLRHDPHGVIVYLGDGATSEGDFHEAMNFAGVYHLPLVVFVQNNHWAISLPLSAQTASETIAQKALAYGFSGIQVDGNDALAVYVATREAFERARSGGGPTLIEAVTYRMSVHTTADDPTKYRSDDEVQAWEKRDPIARFERYLRGRKLLNDELVREIEDDVQERVRAAVERYEGYRDRIDPLDCFKYMYADLPAELVAQREEFRQAIEREAR